ncbi:MAG: putative dihydroorotate dehydrogenase B (NAD(+)), electron transfer subunit [Candidatus Magasanikbacteria bacterium GW2011_GWA2_56_11]|uniref:Putative dihydroorotate dehydrogenase B (NAD(+)), electron transfer subunit n=1 Tax=Candidatus Magasanikbacteria bacterium GW2011_GWA2_56_11 TaxID=1619044 RepID=A0A0G1YI52_9BACT|nr:MAG: putative dihydroorotate dehydrogenase B (NAD(+)), electron transfer subunit [Candidatus Magasanikbacteria bacterium GW2011_GWA2_56_11]
MDSPLLLPIARVQPENAQAKTLYFDHALHSQPGQFVMAWLPGIDQKPFSVAYDNGREFGFTVFPVGPLSQALVSLQPGDRVGITGPYGHPFSVKKDRHYITIGGGYGAGPLALLAERAAAAGAQVDFCLGAKTEGLLLFAQRVKTVPNLRVHIATDDGSLGRRGYVTEILEELLLETGAQTRLIAACGPELMEKKVLDLCNEHDVECEISLERYTKCGFGVCGQCCVDPLGIRMCVEGPVVDRETANRISEFGAYHRDKSGTKIRY